MSVFSRISPRRRGRAGSGPPGGLRPRTCDELGRGGRRDVDAGGETGVREPYGRTRRRRPSAPRGPLGDRLGRDGCSGGENPPTVPSSRRSEGLHAFASGAEAPGLYGVINCWRTRRPPPSRLYVRVVAECRCRWSPSWISPCQPLPGGTRRDRAGYADVPRPAPNGAGALRWWRCRRWRRFP